jgi:HNH endonuclease
MANVPRKRPSRKMSRKLQAEVFTRDHWLCRWCKRPVIFAPALKYLQSELERAGFSDLAYSRFAYDRRGAPLLDELSAVIDHVQAFSSGGSGAAENLATACNKCNMRKSSADPSDWERKHLKPIKARHGEPTAWDGLSSLFLFSAGHHGGAFECPA